MTNTNDDLGARIEQMIAEHIAVTRKAAQAAMERAFAKAGAGAEPPAVGARVVRTRAPGKRRGGAELAALGERFLRAVSSKPGETMTVLAAEVESSPRELHRAVAHLRQAGRVRAIGQRSQTRYFPLSPSGAS
jgi:predicted Zn-dependent protease